MARDLTVKARIVAEDDASATLGKIEGRFSRLGSFLSSRFVVTLGDVTRLFGALWDAVAFGVNEAAEAEVALNKLNVSLARFGPQSDSVRASLLAQADALAKATTATDDEVVAIQTLIANLGAAPDQIARVTAAALDLSAALGVDVSTAATALAKSLEGNGAQLSRMLPQLRDLESAAFRAGEGLAFVEERFGAAAEAQLNTFTGRVGELRQAFAELAEQIGSGLTRSPLNEWLATATGWVQRLAESVSFAGQEMNAAVSATDREAEALALLAHGASAAAVGMDTLAAAELRAARIATEQAASQKELEAALAAAGVTLRDFDTELQRTELAARLLDQAYREGRISLEEYNFAAAQLAITTARITSEMLGAADSTDAFTAHLLTLQDAARGARFEVQGLGSSLTSVAASRSSLDGALGVYVVPGATRFYDPKTGRPSRHGQTPPISVRWTPISTRPF